MDDLPEMLELASVTARLREIDKERDPLRDRAAELVLALLLKDAPPTLVADASPYSPAHVRKLARDHGIPPGRPGVKPRRHPLQRGNQAR